MHWQQQPETCAPGADHEGGSSWLGEVPAAGLAGLAEQGWEAVSELVLGRHLLLWDEILEQPFLQVRCRVDLHIAENACVVVNCSASNL